MVVVDASAVALLFVDPDDDPRVEQARRLLRADEHWLVPEHWPVEVFSVIRGLNRGHQLTDARAEAAIGMLEKFSVKIVPTLPLLPRMWELRHALTGYDAAYVAVAEANDCDLITADSRMARAGAVRCGVQVIAE